MEKYQEYKGCDLPWVAALPAHWKSAKIKYLSKMQSGNMISAADISGEGQFPVYGGNGMRGYTNTATNMGTHILIGRQGALCGNVRLAKGPFYATEHAIVVYTNPLVDLNWYKYLLEVMNLNQYATSAAQPGLSVDVIINKGTFLPPFFEQQTIATYLDHKTEQIDGIIADKEKLIVLLKEKRQAIISEAVTRGLDPAVPMKDSGVEWIGQIPAHWQVSRGKNILTLMKRPIVDESEVITCFRDGEVTLRRNRREDGYTFADKEIGYQGILVGDLVIHGMDGFAGAIGVSDSNGKGSPVLNICTPKKDYNVYYFMYYLRALAQQNVFLSLSTGIRERSCDLRWNKIADIMFPIPPKHEQDSIAQHILEKSFETNELIGSISRQINLLKEYRQSIISEAVTGKVMVAAPQSVEQAEYPAAKPGGANVHFKRRVLAAKILDKLCGEPTLGHVKLEKLLFLSEYCAELDMHTEYVRHAAGPYSPKTLRSIDTQLQKAKWFVYDKNNRGSKYSRLDKSAEYVPYFDANFSAAQNATVERLVELFRPLDTERCEIVATLYGAWNDFLIDGYSPTDEQIADEVLTHWSEEKKRINKDRWLKAIGWMRKHQIVPCGYGEKTKRRNS